MTTPPSTSPVKMLRIELMKDPTVSRHLQIGWQCLALFMLFGLALELMHAFKVQFFLNVSTEPRRLMWTLAHAHGTMLGLLNLAFSFTTFLSSDSSGFHRKFASLALITATVLVPGGFFLGGLWMHGGEPGYGIVLVPLGAILLVLAAVLTVKNINFKGADRQC